MRKKMDVEIFSDNHIIASKFFEPILRWSLDFSNDVYFYSRGE